ncbi:MAG TPA: hypothetical protein ENI59_01215 [Euryarchaeota archaeon]|nr:hypothetical protein [Euryarchaeota archaeon]
MKKMKKGISGVLCVNHKGDVLCDYTRKYPEVTIRLPFIIGYDLSYFTAEIYYQKNKNYFDEILKMLEESPDVKFYEEIERTPHGGIVLIGKRAYGVLRALYETKSVLRGAIIIRAGIKYFPVLVYGNPKDLEERVKRYAPREASAFFKINEDIRIEKLVANTHIINKIKEELTHSEIRAIMAAYELGYFRWPRIHSSEDVANYLAISKSAFLEHLRKAEEKIMRILYEFFNI